MCSLVRFCFPHIVVLWIAGAWMMAAHAAAAVPQGADGERCAALASHDFTEVMDAPTRIMSSRLVAAAAQFPAYCEVRAYVWPQVQFYLWMPVDGWSGRFVGIGCGGACGVIERIDATNLWQPILRHGDVAMFTDMGHTGRDTGDLLWAVDNPQGQIDFSFRATHVATVSGKAIAAQFYGGAPTRAYFLGNSTGGRQGLIEAQRFPADYQGIVAKCPAVSAAAGDAIIWALQSLSDRDGHPLLGTDTVQTLAQAVLARCDRLDGVADGVISEPQRCDFDLQTLSCDTHPGQGCLNSTQLTGLRRAYQGPPPAPGTRDRVGLPKGSESLWMGRYVSKDGEPTPMWDFMMNWLRVDAPVWENLSLRQRVSLADYDVERFRTVRGTYQLLQEATNPDLEEFAARGGKLIMMQGEADVIVQPAQTTRYYEAAVRTAGGLATAQTFFRYFLMPGVGHCFAGDGSGADVFDGLADITRWVETAQAPEKIVAQKLYRYHGLFPDLQLPVAEDNLAFSRPLYPYPARAAFRGSGDPRKAENFVPVVPKAGRSAPTGKGSAQ